MIENEFKVMLTEAQYERVLAMFEWDSSAMQVNNYYDTRDLALSSAHITVRVREKGGRYFLQMKLPNGVDFSRIELEKELDNIPEEISSEVLNELAGRYISDLPDVRRLGELSTLRNVKRIYGAEIDLDKSEYFGKVDHELEVEFTDESAARDIMEKICGAAEISRNGDVCTGKIHRFLAEYRKN